MSAFILALAGLLGLVFLIHRARRNASHREKAWGEGEFEGKRLIYTERVFVSRRYGIVTRIDRAYLFEGSIELLEFKTRARHTVYPSDVIELSAQRVAVEDADGRAVRDVGYVLTESAQNASRKLHRVQLLARDEVLALRARRNQILEGQVEPKEAKSRGLCIDCAYRASCKPELAP